jgi:multidrug efflux pump subunit AcrA (membrane-fusion protein)
VPPPVRRRSGVLWTLAVVLGLLVAGAWWLGTRTQAAPQTTVAIRTVKAARGTVRNSLRVTGTTRAGRFANIAAPVLNAPDTGRSLVLTFLAASGTPVNKGETVAQIDPQSIKDHLADVEANVIQAQGNIRKQEADLAIELENLRQTVRVAKANLEKARLDYSAQEIRTEIDRELLRLSLEEAEAQYNELLEDMATTEERQRIDMRLAQLELEDELRHRQRHQNDLERCTMISPMDGMAVMQTLTRNGETAQIQLGDQVAPGQPFMRIVDLNSLQVEGLINQAESELIRIGQKATIQFDAFPGVTLNGKVTAVGAMALAGRRQSYYVRTVPVQLSIEGRDPRVIPDLSASADITLSESGEGVVIPRAAVQHADGEPVVYVKQNEGFERREVALGLASSTQVMVLSGLDSGEEVALQNPSL